MIALYCKGFYLVDSLGYLLQADNLATNGSWYAEDWNRPLLIDYFSIRPPLYAIFIMVMRLLSHSIIPILIVQNAISITTCWMVYRFVLKQGFTSPLVHWLCRFSMLLYPAQMIHANFVMTEIIFQFWLAAILISLTDFRKQPTYARSILLAVLLCLCILTKPVSLFIPFLAWVFMMIYIVKKKSSVRLFLPQLLVLLTFHGVCIQNQHATGYYHYSSIKSINQLKYNARYTLIAAKGELYADSVITSVMQKADFAVDYESRLRIMNDAANSIIMQYPFSFAKVYGRGLMAYFLDPGRFDMFHFFALEEEGTLGLMHELHTRGLPAIRDYIQKAPIIILLLLAVSFLWNCVVIGMLIYFAWATEPVALRILVLSMILYIALATGPVGVSRYRIPVFPFILTGVLGAAHTFSVRKQSSHA
jgi:hypothetical protein